MDFCLRGKKTKTNGKNHTHKSYYNKTSDCKIEYRVYLSPAGFFDVWQGQGGLQLE